MERTFKTKELQYNVFHSRKPNEERMVLVADAICGAGKTQAAIEYINTAPRHCKFLYVTPYLEEIDRIKKSCPTAHFCSPDLYRGKGSKMSDFQELFDRGENIVCTHALFKMFTPDNFKIAEAYGYTLIMDEVADVVCKYEYQTSNLYNILNPEFDYISIDEKTNQIIMNKEKDFFERNFTTQQLKRMWGENGLDLLEKIKNGCIFLYDTSWKDLKKFYEQGGTIDDFKVTLLMWSFPVNIFKSFEKVFIITYMFEGQTQANYYKYFDVPFKYLHTEEVPVETLQAEFTEHPSIPIQYKFDIETRAPRFQFVDAVFDSPQLPNYSKLKSLIEICDKEKLNNIGDFEKVNGKTKKSALCKAWYINNLGGKNETAKTLTNNTYNYFYNVCKQKNSENLIWTTYKDFRNLLKKSPFSKESCFVSCTARAINKFKERHYCAYLINVYYDPFIRKFFERKDIETKEDVYALSELIQWLFRSAIRADEKIYVYIPSERMRSLLQTWLDGNFIYW